MVKFPRMKKGDAFRIVAFDHHTSDPANLDAEVTFTGTFTGRVTISGRRFIKLALVFYENSSDNDINVPMDTRVIEREIVSIRRIGSGVRRRRTARRGVQ